ncbi:flagellar hook-associated protein FlgK [Sulfurimonas sp. HSL-1716]|uniref:flagellar hook-associated protein FlgK n=1 Tax=Hydrocurvibacter sulfurireducens TaxID=3131937 RepID=UPI0031F869BF
MASIFNTLGIGYSGLNAAQLGIDTTGHNISNANTDGYTRQRVVTEAAPPISNVTPGAVGNGTQVQQIARIFDQFVFNNYSSTSADKEASDFTKSTLQQLSTFFPEIDNVGIKSDMHAYYDLWQSLSDNPDNNAVKVALAQQTQTLTQHIQSTKSQVTDLQNQLNDQLKINIDEVNKIAKEIASINLAINNAESGGINNANDLRDKRNTLELSLSKLVGATVFNGTVQSNTAVDSNIATASGSYNISISGFNLVDGTSYHPIGIDNTDNASGMYDLYYERQDGVKIPFAQEIQGGKVGAILDLRGSTLNTTDGVPTDGVLQNVKDQLDSFAAGLIENTNNVYAKSSDTVMQSNPVYLDPSGTLVSSGLNVKKGSFDVVLYDINGNETARRTITIDDLTTLTSGTDSIKDQIETNKDDNGDNNANNDIDDFLSVNYDTYPPGGSLSINLKNSDLVSQGYTFAIQDNLDSSNSFGSGTNFAGAFGMHKFFDGTNASDIGLAYDLKSDPTKISAHAAPISGNNDVSLDMVQSQFEKIDFTQTNSDVTYNDTVYGMFDTIATGVGTQTNAAVLANDTITAKYNAVQQEYNSVSQVNIDEEMSNLIRYQTSYGAAAKVITTVDQMMNTLLGIKQ